MRGRGVGGLAESRKVSNPESESFQRDKKKKRPSDIDREMSEEGFRKTNLIHITHAQFPIRNEMFSRCERLN